MSSSPFLPAMMALAVVFLLLTVARGKPNRGNGFRAADYGAKPLLSAWEIAILAELRRDMPAGFYACPQVRLKDMLNVETRDRSQFRASLNRVAAKSVDFAIIDERGRVALVIELDDKSHDRQEQAAKRLRGQRRARTLWHPVAAGDAAHQGQRAGASGFHIRGSRLER